MIYKLQIRRSTQQTGWDQLLPDRGSDLQIESSIPKALPSNLIKTSISHSTGTQSQFCRETVALPLLWRRLSAFSHLHAVSNPYLTESTEKIKRSANLLWVSAVKCHLQGAVKMRCVAPCWVLVSLVASDNSIGQKLNLSLEGLKLTN